jgi:hypothetical protein
MLIIELGLEEEQGSVRGVSEPLEQLETLEPLELGVLRGGLGE